SALPQSVLQKPPWVTLEGDCARSAPAVRILTHIPVASTGERGNAGTSTYASHPTFFSRRLAARPPWLVGASAKPELALCVDRSISASHRSLLPRGHDRTERYAQASPRHRRAPLAPPHPLSASE